jgi:hypothetical protein
MVSEIFYLDGMMDTFDSSLMLTHSKVFNTQRKGMMLKSMKREDETSIYKSFG